jgi:hypothetical protein
MGLVTPGISMFKEPNACVANAFVTMDNLKVSMKSSSGATVANKLAHDPL